MTEVEIADIFRQFMWTAVWMGAPIIGTALVVGIIVGLFQALTSIQELTLTFAPKLLMMLLVFWLTAGHMARLLANLFDSVVITTIAGV
ncbi:flagellar biosynthetic protein FliQ [Hyphococcus sp. DH-69]|uniref:flagellar biosynthetic protein FliQ n=1 Tax=Hyphococcus formosus TaxID=3143534 RepID=UPI00398B00F3